MEVFAYSASHDLQEPLRTIGTSAELMKRKWSKQLHDEDAVLLSRILSATQRMGALIEDLLAYNRAVKPEDGPPADVDSGRVLAAVWDGLLASIYESSASIEAVDYRTGQAAVAEFGVFISFEAGSVLSCPYAPPAHVRGSFAPVPSDGSFNFSRGALVADFSCPVPRFSDVPLQIHTILTIAE